jgi:hypothetical protein
MRIASELCVYTNDRVTIEEIDLTEEEPAEPEKKGTQRK